MPSINIVGGKNDNRHICKYCGKLLFIGKIKKGTIEIKCVRCKNVYKISYK